MQKSTNPTFVPKKQHVKHLIMNELQISLDKPDIKKIYSIYLL
jgi:hypothetical protein